MSNSFPKISRDALAKLYIATVIGVGFAILVPLVALRGPALVSDAELSFLILGLAVVVGEVLPVKLDGNEGELVPSTTFMFALVLVGGIAAAMLTQVIASTIADRIHRKRPVTWAFNLGQYMFAIGASGLVYRLIAGGVSDRTFNATQVVAALVAGGVFYVVNTGMVSTVIALTSGSRIRDEFSSEIVRQSATEGILLGLAPLAVVAVQSSLALVPLLALPLLAVQRAGTHAMASRRLALTDALTGLPNRVMFADEARRAIAAAERSDASVVVMLIDLDRFKDINDTLGHHYGDEVLRQMSLRLTELLDPRDTVARLGGDEFAVVVRSARTADQGVAVAFSIRRALAQPFDAEGVSIELGGSVGVAVHPEDGADVETLMQRADVAMYQAKEAATGVERYSVAQDDSSLARLALAADLRRALENSEFVPYFQPKIDLRDGTVVGAEALLRWNHPTQASVSPDVFIPLAEQTGLIVPVTLQVISAAIRECSLWRARGRGDLSVAVNLSARVLVDPMLPGHVEELCRCWDLPTRALVLEITESMIVDDPARTLPIVERLADLGVRLSIDDFGTGYSSLEYMKVLPVAEMKIDRSFVAGMGSDPRDAAIVRHSIDLGRSLGLRVVAEGVESAEDHAVLAGMGCDHAQGFFYSRPVPAADFEAWVVETQGRSEAGGERVELADAQRVA